MRARTRVYLYTVQPASAMLPKLTNLLHQHLTAYTYIIIIIIGVKLWQTVKLEDARVPKNRLLSFELFSAVQLIPCSQIGLIFDKLHAAAARGYAVYIRLSANVPTTKCIYWQHRTKLMKIVLPFKSSAHGIFFSKKKKPFTRHTHGRYPRSVCCRAVVL